MMKRGPKSSLDVFDFKVEDEEEEDDLNQQHYSPPNNHRGFNIGKMSCLKGDLLLDMSGHEPQYIVPSGLKCDNICEELEPRVLSSEATSLVDETLNTALPVSKYSDEEDDVFADADESPSESSPSTPSYIPENDHIPSEEHESSPEGCFGIVQKLGDRNMALVCPDYIRYQGRYSTESVLIFSKTSMQLNDSTTHGDQGILRFEWKIEDIIDIQSQWSKRIEIAIVKLRMLPKEAEDSLVVEELQFAVGDTNWAEKQEHIMSLDARYKAVWNVVVDTETEKDEPEPNGESIWRKSYFPNFVEFFDEVVYPKGDPDAVSISKRDVDLLQPDIFVNDTIIDFYIKYLKNQMPLEKRNRFHFFNSFFFRKLIDLDKDPFSSFEGKAAFQRVRKWTRKVNLFEKDYVFIPVNYSYHWSLIVICHPGEVAKFQDENVDKSHNEPCILHMDSMKGSHTVLKNVVQSYLWEEWKERNKDTSDEISPYFLNMHFVSLELPQQPNAYDCGLFLLHYVERFLEEAPINFTTKKITHYSKFLNLDWFRPEEPCLKRAQIQRLIGKILEGEVSPAARDMDFFPTNNSNNAAESNLELIPKRSCSPSKFVASGNLSDGSQSSEDGIEITLLQTSSLQYGGDSSLVLREFMMDAGENSGGPLLDGQYQTFDQPAAFGAIGRQHMQNDVEACGQFVYTESNINLDSVSYISNDLPAESHDAKQNDFREHPESSIGGSGYSSEVKIQENLSIEKTLIIEEKIDEPESSSAKNLEYAPSQMPMDVAEIESCDHIISKSHYSVDDNDLNTFNSNAEKIGDGGSPDIDVVQQTLDSEIEEQQVLVPVSEFLETSGKNELISGSDYGHLAAKRSAEVLLPESDDEQQEPLPAKRHCLDFSRKDMEKEEQYATEDLRS